MVAEILDGCWRSCIDDDSVTRNLANLSGMVARAGAGVRPIPYSRLNSQNLANAMRFCLTTQAATAAQQIAAKMRNESGVAAAVKSFHRHLPLNRMRFHVMPNRAAVWTCVKSNRKINLSKPAAKILIEKPMIDVKEIRRSVLAPHTAHGPQDSFLRRRMRTDVLLNQPRGQFNLH
ncbi:uncharacterized protein BP01DRAFT_136585 [Aspergillus saccharolyticus JOP 1030-1]|uniref:Uncharacterized protein n=1 Tax=Aspergillus saccharolyticus JOP 1030-1 TaxID=1450539 RepID=A0A318ZQC9_9EURO|nr:hypothetical protein BP01DRAFT_136585 [Aspergillus saccharolyticus JOP 1030-1]PYH42318.1 hypothetical protein BP01DRAFT_136585 [Aspergillus saccharolyticus JOP 1030-1]